MRTRPVLAALCCAILSACPSDTLETPELVYELDTHWPSRSSYPGVGDGRILVTNSGEDSVSLFDITRVGQSEVPELARVPIGLLPPELEGVHHAAIAPSGDVYFIGISNYAPGSGSGPHGAHGTGTADGHVLEIRAEDNVRIGEVRVDRNPGDLVVTPDGKRLLVTHYDQLLINEVQAAGGTVREMDSRLAIIDVATLTREAMVPACPAAHGVVVTADNARAFMACSSDEVAVVDLLSGDHPVVRIPLTANAGDPTVSTHLPYAVALSPDEETLWVSCLDGKDVHAVDVATLKADANRRVAVPGAAGFALFSTDGTLLYVPHQSPDGIAVVETATGTLLRDLPLAGCVRPHQIAPAKDERHALVVCEGDHVGPGALVVLDLSDESVVSTTSVGVFPDFAGVIRRAP
ncbi:MAG: hypothetical protein IRZ16_11710 [Myxococcaceae bacterium]|nr:hypothetical protein [Myxococcaceae bacterium]